ncbi:plasmid SOS inhibition protein A [Klebsiella quasipneumoniae]
MIPANLSLIPLSHERRAAMQAIGEVDKKLARGAHLPEYPYARAFFRYLRGCKRITVRELNFFAPVLSAHELRGSKESWLSAIDTLIESRGACCYLPLPAGAGQHLFPEVRFQQTERVRRQDELRDEKYTRQRRKELCQRERAYQALAGQAEIELAFHTPNTVSSWSSRWAGSVLHQYDLEEMFWRWSERFPSLAALERGEFAGEPFWTVTYEATQLAAEAHTAVVLLERWMVPNKLMLREAV